ncbi:DUF2855 family protein [Thalassomonas viridans]|uniref:DUF2855 family protein n=1 Tax=Thalassomonas viridans TaxID=137584 RepID=A0AAE9Z9J4_9GAMM|nr:DUF2855 family protein [Thalassomonas viridans]WDE08509.1 DUF2855 family protein [Thalassomonas viridans]
MSAITTAVFEVDKSNLTKTRILHQQIEPDLAENEVLLAIDKFALTANNVSYCLTGDSLGYWRFFPADDNWGRIPAMGYAEVIASNCAGIETGERVWGFLPMASHVKIVAGKVTPSGFMDISPHREGLAPVYATFDRVSANPFYRAEREDFEMLLRGLFTTSWLVDDFMSDNRYFGAEQYLITSASSKTSIALAFAVRERNEQRSVGITSAANLAFVEGLGCYDQVITYDDITSLDSAKASVLVDMAGSFTTLMAIHRHFGGQLRYSCKIGATHHNDLSGEGELPGVKPVFFFAPTQVQKRTRDWGRGEVMKRLGAALVRYIEFCRSILTIKHTCSDDEIAKVFQEVLTGEGQASVGHVISLRK